jgi:hypothetical protein
VAPLNSPGLFDDRRRRQGGFAARRATGEGASLLYETILTWKRSNLAGQRSGRTGGGRYQNHLA